MLSKTGLSKHCQYHKYKENMFILYALDLDIIRAHERLNLILYQFASIEACIELKLLVSR